MRKTDDVGGTDMLIWLVLLVVVFPLICGWDD